MVALSANAVEDGQVMYVGGTIPGMNEGAIGRLDTVTGTSLTFVHPGGTLAIPYAQIDSYDYSRKLARRLGVLPTVAVGLLRRRQRNHYFTITYRDNTETAQVVVLEVPKHMPNTLLAVLKARAPKSCNVQSLGKCAASRSTPAPEPGSVSVSTGPPQGLRR